MKQSLMFTIAKVTHFLSKSKYFSLFLHQFDIKIHMASVSSVHSVRNNNSVRDKKRAKRVTQSRRDDITQTGVSKLRVSESRTKLA